MGHAHVARPSRLQQPTIWERPESVSCDAFVKDSVKRSVFLCSKNISSAPRLNYANRGARARRVETGERGGGGGARVWHFSSHSLTKWCNTPPYMLPCWSMSLPTFHMGLNLAPISCLCAAKNLGCMSHGLTHMGFEISQKFLKSNMCH
jgi:hypothetical protein